MFVSYYMTKIRIDEEIFDVRMCRLLRFDRGGGCADYGCADV
jgi:hypothetical protein